MMTDSDTIVTECELAEPPSKVWRALTEPALVAQWLMPVSAPAGVRAEAGARFSLVPAPANGNRGEDGIGSGPIACEVLAAEPPRLLRYSWRGSEAERDGRGRALDTIVTFTLDETEAGGTRLRIVHSGFPPSLLATRCAPGRTMMAANGNAGLRCAA